MEIRLTEKLYTGLDSQAVGSDLVQLCDNEDSHRLVKGRTHTKALLVWTPVQAGDGLCGQGDVLQEVDCPSNSSVHTFSILFTPLGRILTATGQDSCIIDIKAVLD